MTEPGIRVNGRFYPTPSAFTLGEARTIKRMTGLSLPEFAVALGELDRKQDPDVYAAFVWVAIHRVDPTITPELVDTLEFDAITGEGEVEEARPPASPMTSGSSNSPDVAAADRSSSASSAPESSEPSASSSETIPAAFGAAG